MDPWLDSIKCDSWGNLKVPMCFFWTGENTADAARDVFSAFVRSCFTVFHIFSDFLLSSEKSEFHGHSCFTGFGLLLLREGTELDCFSQIFMNFLRKSAKSELQCFVIGFHYFL